MLEIFKSSWNAVSKMSRLTDKRYWMWPMSYNTKRLTTMKLYKDIVSEVLPIPWRELQIQGDWDANYLKDTRLWVAV